MSSDGADGRSALARVVAPLRQGSWLRDGGGTAESANNPAAALMFSIIASIGVAAGQRRFPLPNPSAVPR